MPAQFQELVEYQYKEHTVTSESIKQTWKFVCNWIEMVFGSIKYIKWLIQHLIHVQNRSN
jgi:hypothetical protein